MGFIHWRVGVIALVLLWPVAASADCDIQDPDCVLAVRFAPKVWMHDKESYFPGDVHTFVDASRLVLKRGFNWPIVQENASIDALPTEYHPTNSSGSKRLPSDRKSHKSYEYIIDVRGQEEDRIYRGIRPDNAGHDAIPIYANVARRTRPDAVEIQYYIFFPRDRAHEGDWEVVNVYLDDQERPVAFTTFGHGKERARKIKGDNTGAWVANDQGQEILWRDGRCWTGTQLVENCGDPSAEGPFSHPVVFVSKKKHAISAATRARIQKDRSNRGTAWLSHSNVVLLPNSANPPGDLAWIRFGGSWGTAKGIVRRTGPGGPYVKSQFCLGHDLREVALGSYPERCLPACDGASNWVQVYKNRDRKQPSISDLHGAGPEFPPFEAQNYKTMLFNDTVSSASTCLATTDYYLFKHVNYGGRWQKFEASADLKTVDVLPSLHDEISSSAFDACTEENGWIAFFRDDSYRGKSYLHRSDQVPGTINDFGDVDNLGRNKVSSIRWCLPTNLTFVAFGGRNLESAPIDFPGTGRIEERDLRRDPEQRHPLHDKLESGEFRRIAEPATPRSLQRYLYGPIWAWRGILDSDGNFSAGVQREFRLPFEGRWRLQPGIELGVSGNAPNLSLSLPVVWRSTINETDWHAGAGVIASRLDSSSRDGDEVSWFAKIGITFKRESNRDHFIELTATDSAIHGIAFSYGVSFESKRAGR